MGVTIEREKLEDGTELTRRFEDGILERTVHVKQFPSGKRLMKTFDNSGVLAEESHTYGLMLDISIHMKYKDGVKTYGEGIGENSGNLVVELPEEPADRAKLFKFIGRRAQLLGFEPDLDNGQQYGYIKLD